MVIYTLACIINSCSKKDDFEYIATNEEIEPDSNKHVFEGVRLVIYGYDKEDLKDATGSN
jgi:hypothetical protein